MPKKMQTKHEWMLETEVAEEMRCSVQKLRNDRHMRRGLPYHKVGRGVRYWRPDIEKELNANRIVFD